MIDIKTLNIEEKILLMEELLNELEINSPSWHKKVLDTRKDYKNKKLYSVEELKNEFQAKNN